MVKYYCDKCGKELQGDERYRCDFKIRGYTAITDRFDVEYCEGCLKTIIGEEKFAELLRRKEERRERIEARKQSRKEGAE